LKLSSATTLKFPAPSAKFGTLKGVFIPNVVQMIGVILFMRLGWVLGHVGIVQMSSIICLSTLLLLITGFSLTAIVSNMRMRGGGAYYLISRALGIKFGSAIGILMCISQYCVIALCTTGFALSVYEFFPWVSLWMLKSVTLVVLVLISYFSTNLALKTQLFIFVVLATAIGAIFLGSCPAPDSLETLETTPLTFWMAFAMFFPAMTGIESGMSMSGDLKNPSRSIPLGTVSAIAVVFLTYQGLALFMSSHIAAPLLKSYPLILFYTSRVKYLIIIGIWASTLSSVLGSILGGPRVLQAIAKDGILPKFLAKGYGPTNEPRTATLVTFILSIVLTLATDINQIIPMLTMSCLVSYGLLNFIAFFESFMQNPSWRPSIKIPSFLALSGCIGCFMAMFMINPGATFIVLLSVSILCIWASSRKIKGNWDDLRHSLFSFFVHKGTFTLSNLERSAKSWRPHILMILKGSSFNKNLAFFAHALNQDRGFLTIGASVAEKEQTENLQKDLKEALHAFKITSHIHINQSPNTVYGTSQIIKNYGFGLLKPNTIILPVPDKLYRNNLKNREFGKEMPQNFCSERETIAKRQDLSENRNFEEMPTPPKTDSSGCFGIEIHSFIQMLLDTHRQEKNIVLLKEDPQKDYLYTDPSRKNKQINLWWRGKYPGNFELCLALAYLLQQSKLWPKSSICIKMMTKNEEQKAKLSMQFHKYKEKLRIKNLEFSVLVDPNQDFFPNLLTHSHDASLTCLGLKKPDATTTVEEYTDYYLKLQEQVKGLNNIAYVLCGEKVKFRKIFI